MRNSGLHTSILRLEAAALLAVAATYNDATNKNDWSEDKNNQKSAQSSSGSSCSRLEVSAGENVQSIGKVTLALWDTLVFEPASNISSGFLFGASSCWHHIFGLIVAITNSIDKNSTAGVSA